MHICTFMSASPDCKLDLLTWSHGAKTVTYSLSPLVINSQSLKKVAEKSRKSLVFHQTPLGCWCCWCADAADGLILLMRWCCLCADAADALMLLMCWCCWCADAADALMQLMRWCCWCADPADALIMLMHWSCWCTDDDDALMLLMYWCCWCADALMQLNQDQDLLADLSKAICSS